MNPKPIALVLGGTARHIALIHSLRARGFSPVLVDYLENPPARVFSNAHNGKLRCKSLIDRTLAEHRTCG